VPVGRCRRAVLGQPGPQGLGVAVAELVPGHGDRQGRAGLASAGSLGPVGLLAIEQELGQELSEVAMARRDSTEVSRARYTVTGSAPAAAVRTGAAVASVGSSEVSMTLQIAFGKDHYHNRRAPLHPPSGRPS
jgi:hypothetical protein